MLVIRTYRWTKESRDWQLRYYDDTGAEARLDGWWFHTLQHHWASFIYNLRDL